MGARESANNQQIPYLLSEEDHHFYYREFIQRTLEVSKPSIPPIAYFLGAQPGSGKTKLRVNLQTGTEVIINTDELRWIHPFYSQLLENPQTNELAGHLVNPDATDWSIRLRNEAIEEKRSIIIDSTLGGTAQHFVNLFQQLNEQGYIIEIHLIGMNRFVSRLGIYYRFENGRSIGTPERMVAMEVHDKNYRSLPENLLTIGRNCHALVNKLVIYSRDGNDRLNEYYQTSYPCNFSEAAKQLAHIRERQFSKEELSDFNMTVDRVRKMIEARGENPQKFLDDVAFSSGA